MTKNEALVELKGLASAMRTIQERDGEFAKVHCSVIEEALNKVLAVLYEHKQVLHEKIVIDHSIFYDGSTEKEINTLNSLYPNDEVYVHSVVPGKAHITVYKKQNELKEKSN